MSSSASKKYVLLVSDNNLFLDEANRSCQRVFNGGALMGCFMAYSFADALKHPADPAPLAVIVDVRDGHESLLPTFQRIAAHFENTRMIGAGTLENADMILKLVKLGIKDFLKFPFDPDELKAALMVQNLSNDFENAYRASRSGRIVTVYSPKGGSGVSLLTTNLAVAFTKSGIRVAIIDLAPQLGDISVYMNLKPQYTVRDLIDSAGQIDQSLLNGVMLKHPTGVQVLAAPREDQEPLSSRSLTELQSIFSLLKQSFDIVLVDPGHTDDALLQMTLMQSRMILLLGNLDLPSLKGLVAALHRLTKLHHDSDKIKIILNRYNSKEQLDFKEFEKKAQIPVAMKIPNNYSLCIESINSGIPINEAKANSDLGKKIAELAKQVEAELYPQKKMPPQQMLHTTRENSNTVQIKKGLFGWLL